MHGGLLTFPFLPLREDVPASAASGVPPVTT